MPIYKYGRKNSSKTYKRLLEIFHRDGYLSEAISPAEEGMNEMRKKKQAESAASELIYRYESLRSKREELEAYFMELFGETNDFDKSFHQKQVEKFMKGAGQEVPDEPRLNDGGLAVTERILRARLIIEETLELIERGLGVELIARGGGKVAMDKLNFCSTYPQNYEELVDGICDLKVVLTGTLSALGLPDRPFQCMVDKNNLEKIEHGHEDNNGKWIKPENHPKPPIKELLREMRST